MTRPLKEKTIPIKLDDFLCYFLLFVVGVSIIGLALLIIFPTDTTFFSLVGATCLVGIMLGSCLGAVFWTEKWDLNPVHAIGYCLRWKR